MKTKEQIINDLIKFKNPPSDYNTLETNCFLALKHLIVMYQNKQISSERASKLKLKVLNTYEKDKKDYEFKTSMFQEYINHIKETEIDRTLLRKIINRQDEWANTPNGTGFDIAFDLSIKILNTVFKGEFF